jgi:hypothetical protein
MKNRMVGGTITCKKKTMPDPSVLGLKGQGHEIEFKYFDKNEYLYV